jgi:hypothetical protein
MSKSDAIATTTRELDALRERITRDRDQSSRAHDGLPRGFKSREPLYMRFHALLSERDALRAI